jgi:hypothetical protein
VAYLTVTCGIDSLDEIAYLDGIDDIDTTIKGVVKLPQPQLRTRTYTQTGQSTLRATQVRAALPEQDYG